MIISGVNCLNFTENIANFKGHQCLSMMGTSGSKCCTHKVQLGVKITKVILIFHHLSGAMGQSSKLLHQHQETNSPVYNIEIVTIISLVYHMVPWVYLSIKEDILSTTDWLTIKKDISSKGFTGILSFLFKRL